MTLFTNQQALAQSGDTDSIQARRVLDRSDTLYTRMEKIRQIAAIKASVGPDMPPDHFHLNGKTAEDLQSMLPKGVGPSTAPHINKWLRNGIEDINQLSAEITYVKAKVLLYSRPDEWTKMMFDEASSNLCTVKRKNSKKLQLVAQYLYKTDASQVLDHCPGVIYKKASFIRGDRYACVFSENGILTYLAAAIIRAVLSTASPSANTSTGRTRFKNAVRHLQCGSTPTSLL